MMSFPYLPEEMLTVLNVPHLGQKEHKLQQKLIVYLAMLTEEHKD